MRVASPDLCALQLTDEECRIPQGFEINNNEGKAEGLHGKLQQQQHSAKQLLAAKVANNVSFDGFGHVCGTLQSSASRSNVETKKMSGHHAAPDRNKMRAAPLMVSRFSEILVLQLLERQQGAADLPEVASSIMTPTIRVIDNKQSVINDLNVGTCAKPQQLARRLEMTFQVLSFRLAVCRYRKRCHPSGRLVSVKVQWPYPTPPSPPFCSRDTCPCILYCGFTSDADGNRKKRNSYADSPHRLVCPYCPRAFPWISSLNRHILTHTGEALLPSVVCCRSGPCQS